MMLSAVPPQNITAPQACLVQRGGLIDEEYRKILERSFLIQAPAESFQGPERSETWPSNERIAEKFAALENLRDDWNAGESETPNPFATREGRLIVDQLLSKYLKPTAIMPSVEGGVGITVVRGRRRASIEVLNSGEIVAATYESTGDPDVWEFTTEALSLAETVEKIRVYLSA